jgi:predicted RecA/RadA family phage recombinase
MAQNFVQKGNVINAVPDDPATPKSGDPVTVGKIPGVALTDAGAGGNAAGACSIAKAFSITVDGTAPVGAGR